MRDETTCHRRFWEAVVLAAYILVVGAHGGTRILHFPPDQYMGSLHVEDPCLGSEYMERGRDLSLPYGLDPKRVALAGDFDFAGLAQGDVAVPAGRNVKLIVMLRLSQDRRELASLPPRGYKVFGTDRCREDPEDLSGLSLLDPNDLWGIQVSRLVPTARANEQVLEPISRLIGLRVLQLSGTGITDRGLEHLRSLRSLGALEFSNEPFIGNQGLAVLKDLPSLEYLDLYPGVTDAGLKHVAQVKSLRWLRLRTGRIWGPGLAELAALPRLERLCLWGEIGISDRHIQYLEGLTQLKSLTLWGVADGLTDASLASIGRIRNLEELHFIVTMPKFTPAGVAHLKDLKKLRKIDFSYVWSGPRGVYGDEVARQLAGLSNLESIQGIGYLSAEGMEAIANLRNLKCLHVAIAPRPVGYRGDTGLSHLAGLPSLEELRLHESVGLCDADLACLESMTHLKDLSLRGEGVTDATMTSVGKLHQLERLDMVLVGVTKRGLNQLKGLTNLQTLRVLAHFPDAGPAIDEVRLNISSLRDLKTLSMQGVALRDADLASLAGMGDLEWLTFDAPVTENGLGRLKGLNSLKYMRIDGISCLSDESLAHLADFPRLGDLHLHGRITDTALRKVVGSPSLWSLTAGTDEPIRRETVDHLKQTLPSIEYIHIDRLPKFPSPSPQQRPARPCSVPRQAR